MPGKNIVKSSKPLDWPKYRTQRYEKYNSQCKQAKVRGFFANEILEKVL